MCCSQNNINPARHVLLDISASGFRGFPNTVLAFEQKKKTSLKNEDTPATATLIWRLRNKHEQRPSTTCVLWTGGSWPIIARRVRAHARFLCVQTLLAFSWSNVSTFSGPVALAKCLGYSHCAMRIVSLFLRALHSAKRIWHDHYVWKVQFLLWKVTNCLKRTKIV